MTISNIYSVGRYIELDDARIIAKYGSIVHKSIIYLDLNIGEYSTYKKEIASLETGSTRNSEAGYESNGITRNLGQRIKSRCPSLHLELPSKYTCRALLYSDMCSYCLEMDGKDFYINRFCVHAAWYDITFQRFAVLHVKRAISPFDAVEKLCKINGVGCTYNWDGVHIAHFMGLLCIECSELHRGIGIFIAMNIVKYVDDPERVHDYFTFQNPYHHKFGLPDPRVIDFDKDIIGLLIQLALYRFIPLLLKEGFSPIPKQNNDICCKTRISNRRQNLLSDIRRLLKFEEISSENLETAGYHRLFCIGFKALTLVWRSIPDVLLSENEIESFSREHSTSIPAEEFIRLYKKIVGGVPSKPTPRSLTHYCRLVVRHSMALKQQLPQDISKLKIPKELQLYLNLER